MNNYFIIQDTKKAIELKGVDKAHMLAYTKRDGYLWSRKCMNGGGKDSDCKMPNFDEIKLTKENRDPDGMFAYYHNEAKIEFNDSGVVPRYDKVYCQRCYWLLKTEEWS